MAEPRLGEDFHLTPLQLGRWVGFLVMLPKKTKVGIVWHSYAWRAGIEDALAVGHNLVTERRAAA